MSASKVRAACAWSVAGASWVLSSSAAAASLELQGPESCSDREQLGYHVEWLLGSSPCWKASRSRDRRGRWHRDQHAVLAHSQPAARARGISGAEGAGQLARSPRAMNARSLDTVLAAARAGLSPSDEQVEAIGARLAAPMPLKEAVPRPAPGRWAAFKATGSAGLLAAGVLVGAGFLAGLLAHRALTFVELPPPPLPAPIASPTPELLLPTEAPTATPATSSKRAGGQAGAPRPRAAHSSPDDSTAELAPPGASSGHILMRMSVARWRATLSRLTWRRRRRPAAATCRGNPAPLA
jgi:hypothetical protein